MFGRRDKTRVILDWFTISYRDIWTAVGILALLVIAALAIWYYLFYESPPQAQALEAIRQAERSLNKATQAAGGSANLRSGLSRAREELSQAQELYRRNLYDQAMSRALVSGRISEEIALQAEGTPHVATVMEPYGSVEVKRAHSPRWISAREDTPLYVGDYVRTGPDSAAWVRYLNGTIQEMGPRMVTVIEDYSQTHVDLTVPQGDTTLETAENTVTRIHMPQADTRVEGRDRVHLTVDTEKGTSEVASAEGRTTLEKDGREERIGPNEGRVADQAGVRSFLWLPSPQLVDPPDGRVFSVREPAKEKIPLKWSEVPGAAKYIVEIMEAGRGGQRTSQGLGLTSVDLETPPFGNYLWRVTTQDKEGRSSFPSERRRFRVRDARQDPGAPPRLVVKRFPDRFGPKVFLEGQTEPSAVLTYSVNGERERTAQVNQDGAFKEVVTLTRIGKNEIVVRAQSPTGAESTERIPVDYEGP